MADIIPVARKIKPTDIIPNYEYRLQGLSIDEEEAFKQREYLNMFITENFEIIQNQTEGMSVAQIDAYLKGAKDLLAFVNLWIDSLNTLEEEVQDITE